MSPSVAQPVLDADPEPDLARFSRDPGTRPTAADDAPIPVRRDPYRDRNWLAGFALVVALLSIPGTIVSIFVPLPDLVGYVIGGAPVSIAILGVVASIKLGFSTRMAWLALVISAVTAIAGVAIDAQQFTDLPIPGVTDVPGVNEITGLESDSGL